MSELVRYAKGDVRPALRDRAVAKHGKKIYDEVRTKAMEAEGAIALAGHIMEGFLGLNEKRISLAAGDPATNVTLVEIQNMAMAKIKAIQSSYGSDWDI